MTRNAGYQKLAPGSEGPGVCPVHRLLNYTEVEAKLDAEKIRREAIPESRMEMAAARQCDATDAWHIFIPTRGRMRTLRRKGRQRYADDSAREQGDRCRGCGRAASTRCRVCFRALCASCMTDHHHEGYGTPADSR